MTEFTDYAVFEFLNQGNQCYKINSVRKGISLMQYIKETEQIKEEDFYQLIYGMAEQLEMFYKSEEKGSIPCYGYVNPLSFVVTDKGELRLLDVTAGESSELVMRMQKRDFRVLFVRKEQVLTQTMEQEDDLYGFGKCLQFVYSQGRFQTEFSKIEKWHISRMVERCLTEKNTFECLTWIEKEMKRLQKSKEKARKTGRKGKKAKTFRRVMLMVGIIGVFAGMKHRSQESVKVGNEIPAEKEWYMNRINTESLQQVQHEVSSMRVEEAKDALSENIGTCLKEYRKLRKQVKEKEKKAEELKSLLKKYCIEIDEDGKIMEKTSEETASAEPTDKEADSVMEGFKEEYTEESKEGLTENP